MGSAASFCWGKQPPFRQPLLGFWFQAQKAGTEIAASTCARAPTEQGRRGLSQPAAVSVPTSAPGALPLTW